MRTLVIFLFLFLFLCKSLLSARANPLSPNAGHRYGYLAGKPFDITKWGAVGDGKTLNTKAIQAAIDACHQKGGGVVVVPEGVFTSGSIFLKPGVNLELRKGAVLKGSTNIEDYPKLNTRIEGHFEPWRAALINADGVDHLQINGPGTLDGSGEPFWKDFYSRRSTNGKTTNLDVERPRLALIQRSKHVQISGIRFLNSGFWNLHLYRCQYVTVEQCRFEAPSASKPDHHAPSSDGIDVDSSQDIAIRDCFFSVGDDCIALKGSKGPFALDDKDSPPVERVEIIDCVFEAGGGIVTFGSEATVIRDVKVKRCLSRGPTVLRLKLRPDTPQLYENVHLKDITLDSGGVLFKVSPWTQYFDLKGQAPPKSVVRNVIIENVKGSGTSFGEISGHPQAVISGITLKNVAVQLQSMELKLGNVDQLIFQNVKANGEVIKTPVGTTGVTN